MTSSIQHLVLASLLQNEEYARTVFPFIKPEYFEKKEYEIIFNIFKSYIEKYNKRPSKKSLFIDISNNDELTSRFDQSFLEVIVQTISNLYQPIDKEHENEEPLSIEWLKDKTEEWCKDRALYIAIIETVNILDNKDKEQRLPHAIPKMLENALAVSFDQNVGHSYLDNIEERFDFYHKDEERIKFDLDLLNKITNGGLPRKTLSLLILKTGGGKTAIKCHFAARYLLQSLNVLYLTMEMAEERIAERIDANLFDMSVNDIKDIGKSAFNNKINSIKKKTMGQLFIKEFPTGAAHVGHFRALLNELKQKKGFVPDVIMIDYLNICASSRIKSIGGAVNTYSYVKSIAEEIRGLAIEYNCVIWSSTQSNRQGLNSSDINMENTSDSLGIAFAIDFMLAGIVNDELLQNGQLLFSQLKNRFGDPSYYSKFFVGFDRAKMKLYDLDPSENGGDQSPVVSKKPSEDVVVTDLDGTGGIAEDFSDFEIL